MRPASCPSHACPREQTSGDAPRSLGGHMAPDGSRKSQESNLVCACSSCASVTYPCLPRPTQILPCELASAPVAKAHEPDGDCQVFAGLAGKPRAELRQIPRLTNKPRCIRAPVHTSATRLCVNVSRSSETVFVIGERRPNSRTHFPGGRIFHCTIQCKVARKGCLGLEVGPLLMCGKYSCNFRAHRKSN